MSVARLARGVLTALLVFIPLTVSAQNGAEMPSIPANAREHWDLVRQELQVSIEGQLPELARGQSYAAAASFARALVDGSSPDNLVLFARDFDSHRLSSLNFMIAVLEEIQHDRSRLERVERSLARLQEEMREQKLPQTHLGTRLIPLTAIGVGMVGYIYSYWSGFLGSSAQNVFTENATFLSVSFAGMLVSGATNEIRVLIRSLKIVKERAFDLARSQQALRDLRRLLSAIQRTPMGFLTAQDLAYARSAAADAVRMKAIGEAVRLLAADYQAHRIQGALPSDFFARTQLLRSEVREFAESLSETEKDQFRSQLEKRLPGFSQAFDVSVKRRLFEFKARSAIEAWLRDGGNADALRAHLLRGRSDAQEAILLGNRTTPGARLTLASVTLGVTMIGLVASVGPDATALDFIFSADLIDFIRDHSRVIYRLSGLLVAGALANQVFEFIRLWRRGPPPEALRPADFESLVKVLNEVEMRGFAPVAAVSSDSAEDLIERLTRTRFAPLSCRQIFR